MGRRLGRIPITIVVVSIGLLISAAPALGSSVTMSGNQLVFAGTSAEEDILLVDGVRFTNTFPNPVIPVVAVHQRVGVVSESHADCVSITPSNGYESAVRCDWVSSVSASFGAEHDSATLSDQFPWPLSYQGGSGNDILQSGTAVDSIDGGTGNGDIVTFQLNGPGVSVDLASGIASGQGNGESVINIEHAFGTNAADTLNGDSSDNVLFGDGGNDDVSGRNGDDTVIGEDGQDNVSGGSDDDFVFGDDGPDDLIGGPGNDELRGGAQADELTGGPGDDIIEGGPAGEPAQQDYLNLRNETADFDVDLAAGTSSAPGQGNDTLSGIELILGGSGDDRFAGDDTSNLIFGGPGSDFIIPRAGDDIVSGDDIPLGVTPGIDTVSYSDAPGGMTVDMNDVSPGGGEATGQGTDTLLYTALGGGEEAPSVENVIGGPFADTIIGDGEPNRINGLGGGDTIRGGDGSDILLGAGGNDTLLGENGPDRILGQGGLDVGRGGNGFDRLNGGPRGDRLFGEGQRDLIFGGAGPDRGVGGPGNDLVNGQRGNDVVSGNRGNDVLIGAFGRDLFLGGPQNDLLRAFDNRRDRGIFCGPGGRDRAIADRTPADPRPRGCERVRRR